jgi:hypothetical protein
MFVTVAERVSQFNVNENALRLKGVLAEFKRRNPQFKTWEDIKLCESLSTALDKVLIDITMQRQLEWDWCLEILSKFEPSRVYALCTYQDPARPGFDIDWEGQHTAVVLYIIAVLVFGMNPKDVRVPINRYNSTQKSKIRENYVGLNGGELKHGLDFIDLIQQMIYGVNVDNNTKKDLWVQAAEKQKHFERAGLFATSKKFGDDHEPGAFTLLSRTIIDKSEKNLKPVDVTRMFADYWICMNQKRPVDPKEARILYEYFAACHKHNITVNDDYIVELVDFCKDKFNGDWSASGAFWAKVKIAYENWFTKANPDAETDKYGVVKVTGYDTEWKVGGPFLEAQLKKSTKLKVPSCQPKNGTMFVPAKKDLW